MQTVRLSDSEAGSVTISLRAQATGRCQLPSHPPLRDACLVSDANTRPQTTTPRAPAAIRNQEISTADIERTNLANPYAPSAGHSIDEPLQQQLSKLKPTSRRGCLTDPPIARMIGVAPPVNTSSRERNTSDR